MNWELILTIFQPDQSPVSILYGWMVSEVACQFAGQAMAHALTLMEPAAQILVICRPEILS